MCLGTVCPTETIWWTLLIANSQSGTTFATIITIYVWTKLYSILFFKRLYITLITVIAYISDTINKIGIIMSQIVFVVHSQLTLEVE